MNVIITVQNWKLQNQLTGELINSNFKKNQIKKKKKKKTIERKIIWRIQKNILFLYVIIFKNEKKVTLVYNYPGNSR